MNIQDVVMLSHRYQYLKDNCSEAMITEKSRYIDKGTNDEWVVFNVEVSNAFDVIEIFSAGVKWGLSNNNTLK
jgi:ABC-type polysaccharide/polyol phosphate transport system ATPase subunit